MGRGRAAALPFAVSGGFGKERPLRHVLRAAIAQGERGGDFGERALASLHHEFASIPD